jgi:hypothetical protein
MSSAFINLLGFCKHFTFARLSSLYLYERRIYCCAIHIFRVLYCTYCPFTFLACLLVVVSPLSCHWQSVIYSAKTLCVMATKHHQVFPYCSDWLNYSSGFILCSHWLDKSWVVCIEQFWTIYAKRMQVLLSFGWASDWVKNSIWWCDICDFAIYCVLPYNLSLPVARCSTQLQY